MKKRIMIFVIICGLIFFCPLSAKAMGGEIVIQVASTHKPTNEFKFFAKEFLIFFGELCAADLVPTVADNEPQKVFYLIERRDQGQWRIGVCKPLKNKPNQILGYSSVEMSFSALWVIEGKKIKKAKARRALAEEAAKFLFRYLHQKGA